MAQQLLKSTEAGKSKAEAEAAELQGEVARGREVPKDALERLQCKLSDNDDLEARVKELIGRFEALRDEYERVTAERLAELESARSDLTAAMKDLGIAIDEKRTLTEQIAALVERINSAEGGSADIIAERDAYHDQRDKAREELEEASCRADGLERERDELVLERDALAEDASALNAEASALKAELAEVKAELEEAAGRSSDGERAAERERAAGGAEEVGDGEGGAEG